MRGGRSIVSNRSTRRGRAKHFSGIARASGRWLAPGILLLQVVASFTSIHSDAWVADEGMPRDVAGLSGEAGALGRLRGDGIDHATIDELVRALPHFDALRPLIGP